MSVRLDPEVNRPVREIARRTRQPIGRVINDLLDTALRTRRFPGVTFVDGPTGRRAHMAGTGLDIWEIVSLLRDYGSVDALCAAFPGLTGEAIRIAQAYARAYPEEIKEFLEWETRSPDDLKREFPHIRIAHV